MGEEHNDLREKVLSACSGSILTSLLVTPLDVVKVRLQSQSAALPKCLPDTYVFCGEFFDHVEPFQASCGKDQERLVRSQRRITGTFSGIRYIIENEGAHSLWRGLLPTLTMAIPATVVYFVGYESIRNRLQRSTLLPFSTDIMSPLIAGSTARILAASMISPLELIRTNMQHQGQTGTIRAVMSQIISAMKRDGFGVLWKGLVPTLWRDVPFSALYWTGYESLRKRLRPHICPKSSPLRETGLSFASGALSGAFAAIATTPFDVAKTRKQIAVGSSSKVTTHLLEEGPRGMFPQLAEIWREEGPRGLFKGVGPRILKVAPACAIMIGSYEFGKAFFRQSLGTT